MMFDAQMIDERLEDVVQPRIERKEPAILGELPPLGGLPAQGKKRRLVAIQRFGVLTANDSSTEIRILPSAVTLDAFQSSFSSALRPT